MPCPVRSAISAQFKPDYATSERVSELCTIPSAVAHVSVGGRLNLLGEDSILLRAAENVLASRFIK